MALGILAIAQGALSIGTKIFEVVKARKEAKIVKAENRLEIQRSSLADVSKFFTPGIVQSNPKLLGQLGSLINPSAGLQAISGAGNALAMAKGDVQPQNANMAAGEQVGGNSGGGINPILLIGAGIVLLFLFMRKR
jgi:hypothetical protein